MSIKRVVLSEYSRSKEDSLSDWFFNFIDQFNLKNYECYVFFSSPWSDGTDPADLENIKYTEKLIIFYHWDSLIGPNEFNWYKEKTQYGLEKIKNICSTHHDKHFILVSEQYNLYTEEIKNLSVIYFPTFFPRKESKKYLTCKEKNFANKKWVFLNNQPTTHRLFSLSYILSKNLDKHGSISASDYIYTRANQYNSLYDLSNDLFRINNWDTLEQGFNNLRSLKFEKVNSLLPISKRSAEDKFWNFLISNYNDNLLPLHKTAALEIISTSIYFEPIPFFGEKEPNAVRSKNFIIFISSQHTVKKWRELGFDAFDDIIDHSYDDQPDPALRIIEAIDKNQKLLDGAVDLEKLWLDCQPRFDNNLKNLNSLQDFLDSNLTNKFFQIISKFT